jgi:hypothetical protein
MGRPTTCSLPSDPLTRHRAEHDLC